MMKNFIKKFVPPSFLNFYHYFLALVGAVFYQFPSKKLIVIGITGTKGKSTVVELTTRILEEIGFKVASLSSIRFKIGKKSWPNMLKMTMPGRLKLQKFLREAVNSSCQYAIIEVTSEGILQHRHRFIDFDVAVFTNLSPEHIETHGSFKKYRQAKGELFKDLKGKKISIVNLDDEAASYFLQFPADKKIGFKIFGGRTSERTTGGKTALIIEAKDSQLLYNGLKFYVNNTEFNLKLLGKFNIYNALAAICVGLSQEVDLETCKKALEKVKQIPGRMEIVIQKPFTVIVDYAHTPDSLEKVYQATRTGLAGSTICVLGAAGGGRDKWKRPELGKIAAKYCQEVIVTNEDPYDENPMEIIEQVAKGAENVSINQLNQHKSAIYKILDRREAIRHALRLAKQNDLVVITGKGSEPWMCVAKGRKIPWDDRKIVKEEFKKL